MNRFVAIVCLFVVCVQKTVFAQNALIAGKLVHVIVLSLQVNVTTIVTIHYNIDTDSGY